MLGKLLKILALVAIVSGTPVSASHRTTIHRSPCPMERAREAALAASSMPGVKVATAVSFSDRLPPADHWFFGISSGSGILNP